MVRSSFPGKPAKYFTRKKCSSSVNNLDVEGFTVAEEIVRSLGVFNTLFEDSNEESNFRGFSEDDIDKAKQKAGFKSNQKVTKKGSKSKVKNLASKKCDTGDAPKRRDNTISEQLAPTPSNEVKATPIDNTNAESNVPKDDADVKDTDSINSSSTNALSGKFVLPSRSVHSSRVIKPNKRFFPNEQNTIVSQKKARTDNSSASTSEIDNSVSPVKSKLDHDAVTLSPSSKVILRKPKLNLKSDPFPSFEGPFSSSSSSSLGAQDYKTQRRPSTKVVCGVCGSVRLYKNLQHARKFGIFSCELCRKFIVKTIKSDNDGTLHQFVCSSGNGTCQIRQSALEVNTFPTESKKLTSKSNVSDRCQACWLYLSLRSFRLPKELALRLNRYLPDSFAGKLDYIKHQAPTSGSEWYSGVEDIGSGSSALTCIPPKRPARNKITKLVISRKDEGKTFESRNRGPRIKHVCRSALQVLGQTPANFPDKKVVKVTDETLKDNKKVKPDRVISSAAKNGSKSRSNSIESLAEQVQEPSPAESLDDESDLSSDQPVARMLQDLGRCNNELLDWAEGQERGCHPRARVTLDYWQPYDPDEAIISGFPLLAQHSLPIPSVCFLCGSAGQHKLLHCLICCEPYHSFCVPSFLGIKEPNPDILSKWVCPKCTQCAVCSELGGNQQSCSKCQKSYHTSCLPCNARFNSVEAIWTCPSCLYCKSCNGSTVDLFLGNIPLCKPCFRQRKKGNYCPLCQRCYDENDYSTKMMECGKCKCWVHADCEGLSEEKYQVLSYLPSHIEFVCRLCCSELPSQWSLAVEEELKAGYLKVFKILTKNRAICSMIKSSPQKRPQCSCNSSGNPLRPIPMWDKHVVDGKPTELINSCLPTSEPLGGSVGCGFLTPKITQDDENSLRSVESDLSTDRVVKTASRCGKMIRSSSQPSVDTQLGFENGHYRKSSLTSSEDLKLNVNRESEKMPSGVKAKCSCKVEELSKSTLTLMHIKSKASSSEYTSVEEFHTDVNKAIGGLNVEDLNKAYLKALDQAFPWFKTENRPNLSQEECDKKVQFPSSETSEVKTDISQDKVKAIRSIEVPACQPVCTSVFDDKRMCVLCKNLGEGGVSREERLLYCGNSEWVHANCALWSSEVFEEIDGSLQNVQTAMTRSKFKKCTVCSKKGASVGCCAKSCPLVFHFPCAIDSNCIFLENKEVYCKTHKNLTDSKELQKDFLLSRSIYVELDRRKKLDVPKDWAKLLIGTLLIDNFGEVFPEVSDKSELILPIDFSCSRLFWSSTEPLKLIKYCIKTKLVKSEKEYCPENDINYTIDHSLDFTPPPSPIDDFSSKAKLVDDKDVRAVLNQLIENVCVKEEETNLVDQQGTDLLPPEIKDAIFEDLPHDLLAGICMQDIFPKMLNYDYFMSGEASNKNDKFDPHSSRNSPVEDIEKCQMNEPYLKRSLDESHKTKYSNYPRVEERKQVNLQCRLRSSVNIAGLDKCSNRNIQELSMKTSKESWKKGEVIQVDGQFDSSESEPDEASDSETNQCFRTDYCESRDKPVKCSRCHRTYRSNLGFTRHLPSCTTESSCSDSESSEDGRSVKETYITHYVTGQTNVCEEKKEREVEITYHVINGAPDQAMALEECTNTTADCIEVVQNSSNLEYSVGLVDGNYAVKQLQDCQMIQGFQPTQAGTSTQTLVIQQIPEQVSYMNQYPAIQPAPSIQYVQEPQPLLTASQFLPGYQIQPPITHQTVVQNVPTMLGTVVANHQPMILTNQSTISSYAAPSTALVIANQPVFVNMETVVSNTIMSSSQLISSSSVAGILETNSYSTTTQVYHSAKPPVEIPQSYVVVNGAPQVINNHPCTTQVAQTPSIMQTSASNPWATNYQVNYQESYKADKHVPYPSISKDVICGEKRLNCKPSISVHEPVLLDPLGIRSKPAPCEEKPPVFNHSPNLVRSNPNIPHYSELKYSQPCSSRVPTPVLNKVKPNQIKKELSEPSPVGKVKPQQAVAPVVVRNVSSYLQKKPTPNLVSNSYRNSRLNKPEPIVNRCEPTKPLEVKPIEKTGTAVSPITSDTLKVNGLSFPSKPVLPEKPIFPEKSAETESKPVQNGFKNKFVSKTNEDIVKEATIKLHNKMKEIYILPNFERKVQNKTEVLEDAPKPEPQPPILPPPAQVAEKKEMSGFSLSVKQIPNKTNGGVKEKQETNGGPKISYEVTSEDGFSYTTHNIIDAWNKVFSKVQEARQNKGLEPLPQNPYLNENSALKGLMGLGSNSVKYILEQLPGASRCMKYSPMFHKKQMSVAEKLMLSYRENRSGCARSEPLSRGPKSYDMFNWLASRHRRPPNFLGPDADITNGNSRRGNLNLPMAMRFRYLKETSKISVGVFRSDIHGRGLFCLRNIDNGEMIIEYAGELIRSSLTDTRERYYTARGMGCYMFRIDDKFVVDATMKGNAARFINHSCEPNCYSRIIEILGKKHILIFALRRIKQGEELTYDYKFPLEEDKISCHCLSRKCRKYLN